jgi:glycine/serine hydroxymethyltransferase
MGEAEMGVVAQLMARALRQRDDEEELARVRDDVRTLCSKFDPYPGEVVGEP